MKGIVSGLTTSVSTAATATLARAGIARSAATKVCITGMMTATNSPSATPRGTDRRLRRHSEGCRRCGAKGRSSRYWSIVSRVGTWPFSQRTSGRLASAIASKQPLLLPLPVPFLHRLALVVLLLAAGERHLDLRAPAAVEINGQRNDGEA